MNSICAHPAMTIRKNAVTGTGIMAGMINPTTIIIPPFITSQLLFIVMWKFQKNAGIIKRKRTTDIITMVTIPIDNNDYFNIARAETVSVISLCPGAATGASILEEAISAPIDMARIICGC